MPQGDGGEVCEVGAEKPVPSPSSLREIVRTKQKDV
jgi:hypothetical protein